MAGMVAESVAHLAPGRRTVIQAGGCSGLWPLALADYFEQVYTFEPSPSNFSYLVENVSSTPSITAYPYALGERRSSVGLTRSRPHAGLWTVHGDGDIPMVALDDILDDRIVDAIVLDVEGSELQALHGAERLITASRPLVWFEYLHNVDAIWAFLSDHGYARPERGYGRDYYSRHRSRLPEGDIW